MSKKIPLIVGGLLVVVAIVVGVVVIGGKGSGGGSVVTLNCIGGSEKTDLMADPNVTKILHDRYHLVVNFTPLGSYDQVQLTTAELKQRGVDCLWPSSQSAQSVFEKLHNTAVDFPGYQAQTVLQSPEVIYAGPDGTATLLKNGVVVQRDGRYFIINMKKLLNEYVLQHKTWDGKAPNGLGATTIAGPVTISSTDPAKSNSGFTLSQLELQIVATDDPYQSPTVAQAKKALPTVRALYDAQGLQAKSSDFGFDQWLLQGAELHQPLYAGYESQIIGKTVSYAGDPSSLAALKSNVRILYPEPTIYADHPILALTASAVQLIHAMQDPEIQHIAWQQYGFRSGVSIGTDTAYFPQLALAPNLRTTSPPSAEVTLLLLNCIQNNVCH
jgi:hypothetical protein